MRSRSFSGTQVRDTIPGDKNGGKPSHDPQTCTASTLPEDEEAGSDNVDGAGIRNRQRSCNSSPGGGGGREHRYYSEFTSDKSEGHGDRTRSISTGNRANGEHQGGWQSRPRDRDSSGDICLGFACSTTDPPRARLTRNQRSEEGTTDQPVPIFRNSTWIPVC